MRGHHRNARPPYSYNTRHLSNDISGLNAHPPVPSVVTIRDLTRRFGDIRAVDGLNLTIQQGEVFGLLGHNGAGKTTTVRILNGILAPTDGYVSVMGMDPVQSGPDLRQRTGVLTETPALDERLTGRENLEIFADLFDVPRERVEDRVEELLDTFQLSDRADHRVRTYSKGMKQRLALARTIIHDPELLYLDEPTSGLDPVAAYEVREMIHAWGDAPDRTVFLCTHNLAEAQELCDRVAVIENGKLRIEGSPDELANNHDGGLHVDLLLDTDEVPAARAALADHVRIDDSDEPDRLTVRVDVRDDIPALIDLVSGLGIRIYGVVPQERSLREVYLSLYLEDEETDE